MWHVEKLVSAYLLKKVNLISTSSFISGLFSCVISSSLSFSPHFLLTVLGYSSISILNLLDFLIFLSSSPSFWLSVPFWEVIFQLYYFSNHIKNISNKMPVLSNFCVDSVIVKYSKIVLSFWKDYRCFIFSPKFSSCSPTPSLFLSDFLFLCVFGFFLVPCLLCCRLSWNGWWSMVISF